MPAPAAAAAPPPTTMSHAEHVGLLLLRYIARYTKYRCSARYILYWRKRLSLLVNIPMMLQKVHRKAGPCANARIAAVGVIFANSRRVAPPRPNGRTT